MCQNTQNPQKMKTPFCTSTHHTPPHKQAFRHSMSDFIPVPSSSENGHAPIKRKYSDIFPPTHTSAEEEVLRLAPRQQPFKFHVANIPDAPRPQTLIEESKMLLHNQLPIIKETVHEEMYVFKWFARGHDMNEIWIIFEHLETDLRALVNLPLKACVHDDSRCKFQETCAFLHIKDARSMLNTYSRLKHSYNEYLDNRSCGTASTLIFCLRKLELTVLDFVSRKTIPQSCPIKRY